MGLLTVPLDVLSRYLGGVATRDVLRQCTTGPVIAKRNGEGSFLFPLVHPRVVQRVAEARGITPQIEAGAILYLEETADEKLEYLVAVGESRAVIGYGEFDQTTKPSHLLSAARLSLWYAYETGGIRITHLQDELRVAHTKLTAVEMNGEELEEIIRKYAAPRHTAPMMGGVSEAELKRRVAEQTEELRRELAELGDQNRDLEARLGEVRAALTKKDRELAAERAAKESLEGKLAEERGRYASLRKTYEDLSARKPESGNVQRELERLRRRVAELEASGVSGSHKKPAKQIAPYPLEITSDKDRFLYDLAKSLMRRCIERGRYKENDIVGLGWSDSELYQTTWQKVFSFYLIKEQELGIIATTDPATNASPLDSIRQVYYNASKNLTDLFPGLLMGKIPAYTVLFLQLTSFGPGRAKSFDKIQAQLGFTPEQIRQAPEQGLLLGTESSIERLSLNETMRLVYPLFMKYRNELYQQCTSQSL